MRFLTDTVQLLPGYAPQQASHTVPPGVISRGQNTWKRHRIELKVKKLTAVMAAFGRSRYFFCTTE